MDCLQFDLRFIKVGKKHLTMKVSTPLIKLLYGYRGSRRLWKDAVAEAATNLTLKPNTVDNSLHMDKDSNEQHVPVEDDNFSGDAQFPRRGAKIEPAVLGKKGSHSH